MWRRDFSMSEICFNPPSLGLPGQPGAPRAPQVSALSGALFFEEYPLFLLVKFPKENIINTRQHLLVEMISSWSALRAQQPYRQRHCQQPCNPKPLRAAGNDCVRPKFVWGKEVLRPQFICVIPISFVRLQATSRNNSMAIVKKLTSKIPAA